MVRDGPPHLCSTVIRWLLRATVDGISGGTSKPAGGGMAGVRLHLLGGFACESSGSTVSLPFGMQRLVAFIALRGPSHRCEVAGSLWPDVPEPRALASLRTGVWRVNTLVHGLLEVHGNGLRMPTNSWVD